MARTSNNTLIINILIFLLLIAACRQKEPSVRIFVAGNHQSVSVSGLSAVDLGGLQRDSLPLQAWQALFPVCAMPTDTDMKDDAPALSGKYQIANGLITFTPDSALKKGQVYFARYYRFDQHITPWDIISHRRELGRAKYIELSFRP